MRVCTVTHYGGLAQSATNSSKLGMKHRVTYFKVFKFIFVNGDVCVRVCPCVCIPVC